MIFRNRATNPELMDNLSVDESKVKEALGELFLINKYLGGRAVTGKGIRMLMPPESDEPVKILDIGSGLSDSVLYSGIKNIEVISADINEKTCRYLSKQEKLSGIICCDVNYPPFKNNAFDIVHLSLFLHHFDDEEIVLLLRKFLPIVKLGLVINDLRRSFIAYLGIKILTTLFSKSRLVKYDGPLSVKRSFVKKDIRKILSSAGIADFSLSRHWAFRWLVVIRKSQR